MVSEFIAHGRIASVSLFSHRDLDHGEARVLHPFKRVGRCFVENYLTHSLDKIFSDICAFKLAPEVHVSGSACPEAQVVREAPESQTRPL